MSSIHHIGSKGPRLRAVPAAMQSVRLATVTRLTGNEDTPQDEERSLPEKGKASKDRTRARVFKTLAHSSDLRTYHVKGEVVRSTTDPNSVEPTLELPLDSYFEWATD